MGTSLSGVALALALEAGVEPIGVHGLRHTRATLALESGIHAKVVQERLGHANIATTLDIYCNVVPEMDQNAAETVVASPIDFRASK
jgi:integrase